MARALCVLAVCCLCTVAPAAPTRRRWQLSQADAAAMSSADAASVAAVLLELSGGGGGGGGGGALRGSNSGALRAADVSLAPPPEEGASSGEDAAATTGAPSKTAKTPKCPKTKRGVCNGSGDCDEATGKCTCKVNWGGAGCTKDKLKARKVYLGSHMSPLPEHLMAVCEKSIRDNLGCPKGHGLLVEQMCMKTLPMVEGEAKDGYNCGAKSVELACTDPKRKDAAAIVVCPRLCKDVVGWYCGLNEWDAGLVRNGLAPGSRKPPLRNPAKGEKPPETEEAPAE